MNSINLTPPKATPSLNPEGLRMTELYLAVPTTSNVPSGECVLIKLGTTYMIIRDKEVTYTTRLQWMCDNYSVIRALKADESVTLEGGVFE